MATRREKQYLKMLEEGLEVNLDKLQNYSNPAADVVNWRGDGPLPTKLRSKDLDSLIDDIANDEDDSLDTEKAEKLEEDSDFEKAWNDSETLFEEVEDDIGDMDEVDEEDEEDYEEVVAAEDDLNEEEDDDNEDEDDIDFEVEEDEVEDSDEDVNEEDVLAELSNDFGNENLGFLSESPRSILEDDDESYEISQLIKETELLEDDLDSSFMFGNFLTEDDDNVEEEVIVSNKDDEDEGEGEEDYDDLDEDDYEEVEVEGDEDEGEDVEEDEDKEVVSDEMPDDVYEDDED